MGKTINKEKILSLKCQETDKDLNFNDLSLRQQSDIINTLKDLSTRYILIDRLFYEEMEMLLLEKVKCTTKLDIPGKSI